MLVRKVFQWALVLTLLIAAVGGYVAWRMWERRNVLLLEGIRAEVAAKAPDWDVGIQEARLLNRGGQIRLKDIAIKPRGEAAAILQIPECVITVDPEMLLKQHQVLIRSIALSRPTVTLIRHADGSWNWQKLGRPTPSEQTPEVVVEAGSFVVRVEASAGLPETEIASRDVALNMLPAGLHRYLIQGASQIDGAGGLSFTGKIDLNTGAWELGGSADGLDMSPALLEKAAVFSPAVQRQVAELSGPPPAVTPGVEPLPTVSTESSLIRPASQSSETQAPLTGTGGSPQLSLPSLGLIASIAVDFDLKSDGVQEIPDYRLTARVMEGQVSEPLSPVPLSGLEGELLLENDRVVIRRVAAAGGESHLSLDGEFCKQESGWTKQFNVFATNLWLDPQVGELLSPEGRKLFQLINPSGRFTVNASYDSEASRPIKLEQLTALDCAVRHQLFPYPVEHLTGTITQAGERLRIDLRGEAAGRPILITGDVSSPGTPGQSVVNVEADQFPIDERITEAIVAPEHESARKALEALQLTGLADLRAKFTRPAGEDRKFQMSLDAKVSQAALSFRSFPYQVDQLSGRVHYDPLSRRAWEFTDLKGRHGPAVLDGNATFDLTEAPGRLALTINAHNARLDDQLRHATRTADASLDRVWTELNPSGWLQIEGLDIRWSPGGPPEIVIPSVTLQQGTVIPAGFPYRWDDVTAELSWRDGRVALRTAKGRHETTTLEIDGSSPGDPAFVEIGGRDGQLWTVRLPVISIQKLDPGREFIAALPESTAAVVNSLDVRGEVDVELGLELKGWRSDSDVETVTSAWQLDVTLPQNRLFAGLEFTDVTGHVEAIGRWDDHRVLADGQIHFDQARTLDITFTNVRGPFSVNGSEVTVGSAGVLQRLKAPSDEQLTASVYGGMVKINSNAMIDPEDAEKTRYRVQVDIDNANLSQWAAEWGAAAYNVAGTVNGLMNLQGQGTSPLALNGDGCWMHVTQARLGELPQMAQLLAQLTQLQQPDKTAFTSAYAEFSVRNGVFEFGSPVSHVPGDTRRIQLDGDVLRMVGRGIIPFAPGVDPRMNLTFLSKVADRNRLVPPIPFIREITKSMVDNWIRIHVTGTPSHPNVVPVPQVPIGNVNDALREIFTTVESGINPMLVRPPMP